MQDLEPQCILLLEIKQYAIIDIIFYYADIINEHARRCGYFCCRDSTRRL